ncbi:MAG: hypothetical protein F4107_00205 [Gemmatimonadetes bacterium]|nr:hypothetical protein [Gemmatimonadota bacterium]MYD13890.1 hypothetical protein [Gemmatimonadota bacterium]MYI64349.1 hypothetical protein [Gemmatimonadota bacterium]
MSLRTWRRIAWAYHILFAIGVTWPVQALVNDPEPFVLGLPTQMMWAAGWVLGSLLVLWRVDSARSREIAAVADRRSAAHRPGIHSAGTHGAGSPRGGE